MKLNLFINHYNCGDKERQKELDYCLKTNRESGYFDNIINFEGRITYNDFFKETANYPEDINILANTDIYFNETIKTVLEMRASECYCITRWEEDNGDIVRFKDKHGYNNEAKERFSQDVWVIKGKAKQINGAFHLGRRGCDNRIAYEFIMARYQVSNPCDKIQCIHRHKEKERNYTMPQKVSPPYKFIAPTDEGKNLMRRNRI